MCIKDRGDSGFAEEQSYNLNCISLSESSGDSVDFHQLRNLHYTSQKDCLSKQTALTDIVDVELQ